MHTYILRIGFNVTSCLRASFYFVCLPTFSHSKLWGSIINIYFKSNVVPDMEKSFLPKIPGRGLFLLPFKILWLDFLSTILNLRHLRWYHKWIFNVSDRSHKISDILYENILMRCIHWRFYILIEIFYWWNYGNPNFSMVLGAPGVTWQFTDITWILCGFWYSL